MFRNCDVSLVHRVRVVVMIFDIIVLKTIDMKVNLVNARTHLKLVDYLGHHFQKRTQIHLVLAAIIPFKFVTGRKLAHSSSLVDVYYFLASNLTCEGFQHSHLRA